MQYNIRIKQLSQLKKVASLQSLFVFIETIQDVKTKQRQQEKHLIKHFRIAEDKTYCRSR